MKLKGIFQSSPAGKQLAIVLLILLFCISISNTLISILISTSLTSNPTSFLQLNQLISTLAIFAFPAFACAYLFSDDMKSYLSIKKASILHCLLVAISIITITPAISLIGLLNQEIVLPDSLHVLEDTFRIHEEVMKNLTNQFFAEKSTINFIRNVMLIAVAAAITEELFFRAAMQRIIAKTTKNYHIIIWGAAFVFSIFHFQFYGFIPRMLLGAYFGYLLFWSQSLLLPIIAHFTNNLIGVISLSQEEMSSKTIFSAEASSSELILPAIIGTSLFILICNFMRQNKTRII